MGYTTKFEGELSFVHEVTDEQLAFIRSMCGIDLRLHPDFRYTGMSHMDIMLHPDYDGIQWNGAEKTYDLVEKLNLLIALCREKWDDFGLEGVLYATGERHGDRWAIEIGDDGFAHRRDVELTVVKNT